MTHWDMLNKATKFECSLSNMSQCVIEKESGIFDITARPTSKRLSLVFALLVGIHRCRLSLFFAVKSKSSQNTDLANFAFSEFRKIRKT